MNWKGDEVEYKALHKWVGKHKKKPKRCERCDKETLLRTTDQFRKRRRKYL